MPTESARTFIAVRNFQKFQHYTDRRPPWIKLYRDLLDDERFFELSDQERYHLIGLFILASQHDNKIPNNPEWLKHQLRTKARICLQKLIDTGWVDMMEQDASGVLAPCLQDASPRAHAESRDRVEKNREETETDMLASRLAFGEFENVMLSREEHGKLIHKFGNEATEERIQSLSIGIASKGYKYKNFYARLLTWKTDQGVKPNGQRYESRVEGIERKNKETIAALLRGSHGETGGSA